MAISLSEPVTFNLQLTPDQPEWTIMWCEFLIDDLLAMIAGPPTLRIDPDTGEMREGEGFHG